MTAAASPSGRPSLLSDSQRLSHLRWMILARVLDDRMSMLYKQSQIAGSVFTGRGQEAFSAAGGMFLRQGDVFAPMIRDLAGRLAFGEPILEGIRTYLGRRTGPMRGRDGNIHRGSPSKGLLPMISHLGAMVSVTCGVLVARRLQGRLSGNDLAVGMTAIGDGGMAAGALHEGLNLAAVEKLPLVLMVTNNQLSYSTLNDRSFACKHLVDRALGYGVQGHACDGTDADACLSTMQEAVARARRGEGPQMVVATLLRLAGHGAHDDALYVPADLKSRFGDCLQLSERTLKLQGVASEASIQALWDEVRKEVDQAVEQVRKEPPPDPDEEDWCAYSTRDLTKVRT